jgi:aspartyl-tRNA(Asn)/glutamyl-tRNA(Gln) amidotransferase subunit A
MAADARTITELARQIRSGTSSAEAATEQCLARIAERDRDINAYITVTADDARAQAREADRELNAGRDRGPLHGVPISLKDLIDMRGTPTTAASRVRAGHVAAADALVTTRLREAGAVFVGKTNLHEFAFGTTNEDSAYGPVHHPLDLTRSPGGSSGGSAASVLDGMAYASIGTDTGGSIRIPSSLCGLVGLKPHLGEIPLEGVVPLSTLLDHVGPICRSVEDAAIVYHALRGVPNPPPIRRRDVRGLRLGVPRPYFMDLLDTQVRASFEAELQRLTHAGALIENVAIPHARDASPIYVHLSLPEAASYHAATLETRPDDYTSNVRLRIEMGRYILAEDYVRALCGREVLIADVNAALVGRDALLLPTMAIPAQKLGAATVSLDGTEEPVRNAMLRLTQPFNISGHAAISIPCGRTSDGLPLGAQIVGAQTASVLEIAAVLESVMQQ